MPLIAFDYKSFHVLTLGFEAQDARYMRMARLDMHSFFALCGLLRLEDADRVEAMDDAELAAKLKWWRKQPRLFSEFGGMTFGEIRDQKAKRCIAEGELVLTTMGLIPIEEIKSWHRIWDGVEWVTHSGVVYQGEQEVITYDGLSATPNHEVVLENGESISFGKAASRMERLLKTGAGELPIRAGCRDKLENSARKYRKKAQKAIQTNSSRVFDLQDAQVGGSTEPINWGDWWLSELLANVFQIPEDSWPTLRRYRKQVQESKRSSLDSLRGAGNKVYVCLPEGICEMGGEESAPHYISESRDRSDQQQWPLRTREFEIEFPARTDEQSTQYNSNILAGEVNSGNRLDKSLQSGMDMETGQEGNDWRANPRTIRVYDILNAGPRNCFTVSNSLVFNCILGIGFGQQEYSLYSLNPESFTSTTEARMVLDRLNGLFPKPEEWRWKVRMEADEKHQLVTRFGHVRRFWDVFQRKPVAENYEPRRGERVWTHKSGQRWLLKPGDDHEAVVAFLPASDAFGIIRSRMVELGEKALDGKFGLINQIHDSLVFDCPVALAEECLVTVKEIMERPSGILIDPVVAPDGLWCAVEAKMGENLAEMTEAKWV